MDALVAAAQKHHSEMKPLLFNDASARDDQVRRTEPADVRTLRREE